MKLNYSKCQTVLIVHSHQILTDTLIFHFVPVYRLFPTVPINMWRSCNGQLFNEDQICDCEAPQLANML